MRVRELIAKLQEFPQELEVRVYDDEFHEGGLPHISIESYEGYVGQMYRPKALHADWGTQCVELKGFELRRTRGVRRGLASR